MWTVLLGLRSQVRKGFGANNDRSGVPRKLFLGPAARLDIPIRI